LPHIADVPRATHLNQATAPGTASVSRRSSASAEGHDRVDVVALGAGGSEEHEHQSDKSIIVDAPVNAVYNQWTQFEEFPQFMGGVESVTHSTMCVCAGLRRSSGAP
jgi:uncharacterized membrane protein